MRTNRREGGKVVRGVELFTCDGVQLKTGGTVYFVVRDYRDGHDTDVHISRMGQVVSLGPSRDVALIRFDDGTEFNWSPHVANPYQRCARMYAIWSKAQTETRRENRERLDYLRKRLKECQDDIAKFKKAAGLR